MKKLHKRSDTLNPLDFIDPQSPDALDECNDLAEALVIRTGHETDPHWADSAEIFIGSALAAVAHLSPPEDRSLQTVRRVLTDPRQMEGMIQRLIEAGGPLTRLGQQLCHFKDKELASVLTTTSRFLRFLDTPALMESTRTSSFDPSRLNSGRMTIYLVLPPEHMRSQSPTLRAWLVVLLRAVIKGGLS